MRKLTPEEAAAMVAKMMLIESIVGTHGLSLELSRLARWLLEEGHDAKEVIARVEDIRNDAGEIDELERRELELAQALHHVQNFLGRKRSDLVRSEDLLRALNSVDDELLVEVGEAIEEIVEFDNELEVDEVVPETSSATRGSGRY